MPMLLAACRRRLCCRAAGGLRADMLITLFTRGACRCYARHDCRYQRYMPFHMLDTLPAFILPHACFYAVDEAFH